MERNRVSNARCRNRFLRDHKKGSKTDLPGITDPAFGAAEFLLVQNPGPCTQPSIPQLPGIWHGNASVKPDMSL